MKALFAILDGVAGWVYVLVIAGLLAVLGSQWIYISSLKTDVATGKTKLAEKVTEIERERRAIADLRTKHAEELRALQTVHAKTQQETIDAYDQKLKEGATALAAERARNQRLRNAADQFATIAPATGQSGVDAATIQDAQRRLTALSGLLEEARSLVEEAGSIVRDRDAQIDLLISVVRADRAACSAIATLWEWRPLDPEWIAVVGRKHADATLAD